MSGELAAALVKAQAAMPAVEPNATNPHFRSKFVSLDHLIARTRPVLNRHGLAITQAPATLDNGAPALRTTIYHEAGECVSTVMPLILAGQDMQKLGAALTYARRYAWAAALGIASEEDDDGNVASEPEPDLADPAREAALLELVAAKGGDVEKTRAGMETARAQGKLSTWLPGAEEWWAGQDDSYANRIPDGVKAGAAA